MEASQRATDYNHEGQWEGGCGYSNVCVCVGVLMLKRVGMVTRMTEQSTLGSFGVQKAIPWLYRNLKPLLQTAT